MGVIEVVVRLLLMGVCGWTVIGFLKLDCCHKQERKKEKISRSEPSWHARWSSVLNTSVGVRRFRWCFGRNDARERFSDASFVFLDPALKTR